MFGSKKIPFERVCIAVTNSCNLRCRMCDIPIAYSTEADMPLDLIQSIIKSASKLGAKRIDLTGGEAMLRKDIYDIISYASSLGMIVFMASNGILIGEEEAEKLLHAGLGNISVSLEGPEELHDYIRGKGTFKKTLNTVKILQNHKNKKPDLEICAGIVLSNYNYKLIVDFSKYLIEEVGIDTISIQPFQDGMMPTHLEERKSEFHIPPEMMDSFNEEMDKLMQYSEKTGKLPRPSRINRYKDYFLGKKIVPESGCSVPATYLGIAAGGFAFPCWKMPIIGNVRETSVEKLFKSVERKNIINDAKNGQCPGCLDSCFYELY